MKEIKAFVESLRGALAGPLPGRSAQGKMINYPRPEAERAERLHPDAKRGAVLALLYPGEAGLRFVLTLRHVYQGVHSGQVSLPGGKVEAEDSGPLDAALRETREEVGVDPDHVDVLGALSPLYIPPSRFMVYPFVGYTEPRPSFKADPTEVARILEAPLGILADGAFKKEKQMYITALGAKMPVKYYDVDGQVVWGATAMILSELEAVIATCVPRL